VRGRRRHGLDGRRGTLNMLINAWQARFHLTITSGMMCWCSMCVKSVEEGEGKRNMVKRNRTSAGVPWHVWLCHPPPPNGMIF